MFYSIRHLTKFRYSSPVSESIMEVRKTPRSEGAQGCLSSALTVLPRARIFSYRDYLGNTVHHFDVPGHHRQLSIVAESLVDVHDVPVLPSSLGADAWKDLDDAVAAGDFWEMLMPSTFARSSPQLDGLAFRLGVERRSDPLSLIRELNSAIYVWFDYAPKTTRVDSPIEEALSARRGVCQDFAHVMIALVRRLGIPCRYVSGYLSHDESAHERSSPSASHAWVEAYLPELGWVGFDPTNDEAAGERHIRTAIGRDYADVPPTKGTFKGNASSELTVAVSVELTSGPPPPDQSQAMPEDWQAMAAPEPEAQQQQMQQQQQ
jgi:transglutaminase-like putative cysteine protease